MYQDGKFLGKGSRTLLLSGSSASKIRGKAAGYLTKTISVGPSSPKEVRLHLNPAGKGSVQFRFFPANAVIRLDGKRLDAQGANLVQRELPVGDHTLELSDGSGARKVRSFTVVKEKSVKTLRLQD